MVFARRRRPPSRGPPARHAQGRPDLLPECPARSRPRWAAARAAEPLSSLGQMAAERRPVTLPFPYALESHVSLENCYCADDVPCYSEVDKRCDVSSGRQTPQTESPRPRHLGGEVPPSRLAAHSPPRNRDVNVAGRRDTEAAAVSEIEAGRTRAPCRGAEQTDTCGGLRGGEQATGPGFRGHARLCGDLASILLRRPGAGSPETPRQTRAPGGLRPVGQGPATAPGGHCSPPRTRDPPATGGLGVPSGVPRPLPACDPRTKTPPPAVASSLDETGSASAQTRGRTRWNLQN